MGAALSLLPALASAADCSYSQSAYGQGAYSTCVTAAPTILGLPDTGATWIGLVGAALFAIAGGTYVWLRQRRHRRQLLTQ
jgi:LPXTG-motif cell wall-anchored protein